MLPLTYGRTSVGTQTYRVGGRLPDQSVSYSEPFTFTRQGRVSAASAGSARVGVGANVWGTVTGASRVPVWTEVWTPGGWSQSARGTTGSNGGYVLPLTYGSSSAGTQRFRVAASYPGGVVRSAEFTFTRTGSSSHPAPGGVDCAKVACVAITFDDGPGPYTAELLDILKANGVKATFFTVGRNVDARPSVVRRARAEGHQVGNHSYDHPDLTKLGASSVRSQLQRTSDAVNRATGARPSAVRPPYGAWNQTTRDVVRSMNAGPIILWDVDTLDWKHRDASKTIAAVRTNGRRGSIILMHDIHRQTVDAVPGVIQALKGKGYHLVTVDQLLASEQPASGSIHTHGPR